MSLRFTEQFGPSREAWRGSPQRSLAVTRPLLAAFVALATHACGGDINTLRSAGPGTAGSSRTGSAPAVPSATSAVTPGIGTGVSPAIGAGAPVRAPMAAPHACENLQCRQSECATGSTTVSGHVFDPAGKNPLYNVVVYVPNEAVAPLASGATCDSCNALYTGKPVAAALTDAEGKFTLEHVPDGANVPLVIQVGKWRRQLMLPSVTKCQDNPQPDGSLRLPRNHGEGDIPNIAISTGSADTLECLLRRVGVDATEYVPGPGGEGRIHIFQGSPRAGGGGQQAQTCVTPAMQGAGGAAAGAAGQGAPTAQGGRGAWRPPRCFNAPNTMPPAPRASTALWSSKEELLKYDVVLLSCEGAETEAMNQQALHDYASAGGRVFASHFHYSWFNTGPYASENLATWSAGANEMGDINATIVTTLPDGSAFPKGVALQGWLTSVHALAGGKLPIEQARHNAEVMSANTPSQNWILADQDAEPPGATQYFSFNTPTQISVAPDSNQMQCGRVVFSDLHVGAASNDDPGKPVPTSCTDVDLSPQEKALEFMLFDLSSCVMPDRVPPTPPPVQ